MLEKGVDEGGRSTAAAELAGLLIGKGLWANDALIILRDWNQRNRPPLEDWKLQKAVDSIERREEAAQERQADPLSEDWHYPAEALLQRPIPDETWFIEGLITDEACTVVGAPPKFGKTWTALSIAVGVATGAKVFDCFRVAKQGPVLYVAGEDREASLNRRLRMMLKSQGLPASALKDLHIMTKVCNLGSLEWQAALLGFCKKVQPVAIIFDPITRMHTVDENSAERLKPILAFLRRLQMEGRCAVILTHHLRKPSGNKAQQGSSGDQLRGSGDLYAWLDSYISLNRVRKGSHVMVTTEHRNAAPGPGFVLSLDIGEDAASITVSQEKVENIKLAAICEKVFDFVLQRGGEVLGKEIEAEVGGRAEDVRAAVGLLLAEKKLIARMEVREAADKRRRRMKIISLPPSNDSGPGSDTGGPGTL